MLLASQNLLQCIYNSSVGVVQRYAPKKVDEWDESFDPKGWWISTKFPGTRVYWNGKLLKTKYGKVIDAPSDLLLKLPAVPLEGVLQENSWKTPIFRVFDAPAQLDMTYEARMEMIRKTIPKDTENIRVIESRVCRGREDLKQQMQEEGGIILRKPRSYYHDPSSFMRATVRRNNKL